MVGIIDTRRRALALSRLDSLFGVGHAISVNEQGYEGRGRMLDVAILQPVLRLSTPRNISSYFQCRKLLKAIGDQYKKRQLRA